MPLRPARLWLVNHEEWFDLLRFVFACAHLLQTFNRRILREVPECECSTGLAMCCGTTGRVVTTRAIGLANDGNRLSSCWNHERCRVP